MQSETIKNNQNRKSRIFMWRIFRVARRSARINLENCGCKTKMKHRREISSENEFSVEWIAERDLHANYRRKSRGAAASAVNSHSRNSQRGDYGDEVIVWHFSTYTSDKSAARYRSWRDACRDCRAYATGLQARFKRQNVHYDTPDVSFHSCVSPLRHQQTRLFRIVRVDPWQSSSKSTATRRVSRVKNRGNIYFTAITIFKKCTQ